MAIPPPPSRRRRVACRWIFATMIPALAAVSLHAQSPECHLLSPAEGTVVTTGGVPANFIRGTARAVDGPPLVTLQLLRVPNVNVITSEMSWNGDSWVFENQFGAPPPVLQVALATPGGAGLTADWAYTGALPQPGAESMLCLTNGYYRCLATARDQAGRETTTATTFSVNYQPTYLTPAAANAVTLPDQSPARAEGTVAASTFATYSPLSGPADPRTPSARFLRADAAGTLFVGTDIATPEVFFFSGGNTLNTPHPVIQRLGASSWRREREIEIVFDAGAAQYRGRWSSADPFVNLPADQAFPALSLAGMEVDSAGNCYAAFRALQPTAFGNAFLGYGRQVLVVKFSPTGQVLWERALSPVSSLGVFGDDKTSVFRFSLFPDGSLGLLLSNTMTAINPLTGGLLGSDEQTVVASLSPNGDLRFVVGLGNGDPTQPPAFESAPLGFGGDSAGNTYVVTTETARYFPAFSGEPDVYRRSVIRKLGPTGTVLATKVQDRCEFPEVWLDCAVDPAGNVYLGARFAGTESPTVIGRAVAVKFDSSLQFQWRTFGSPYGPGDAGTALPFFSADASGVLLVDSQSVAQRINAAGQWLWARPMRPPAAISIGIVYSGTIRRDSAGNLYVIHVASIGDMVQKLSSAGDHQFSVTLSPGQTGYYDFVAQPAGIFALRQGDFQVQPPSFDTYVTKVDNPANLSIPVTLDPALPADRFVDVGGRIELRVANTGTSGTYQWRKYTGNTPVAVAGQTTSTLVIEPAAAANAGSYDVVVTNASGSATSRKAVVTVGLSVAAALDAPAITWTTNTGPQWSGQTTTTHDGVDAAVSPAAGINEFTWLQTIITGPGRIRFWWRTTGTSSATAQVSFDGPPAQRTDGTLMLRGGNTAWAQEEIVVPEFGHTLLFGYTRFDSAAGAMYLDQVEFISDSTFESWITRQGFSAADLANPAVSGLLADPDRDTVVNLLEFAFVMDPRHPDAGLLPSGELQLPFLRLKYRRPPNVTGIEYIPEISYDGKVWIPDAVYSGSFDQINWEADLLPSETDTLMRLRIVKP